jgi:asparagine synthase (glutamine-hydrolysing)
MCGIFGRLELASRGYLNFSLCRTQMETLRPRGPDGFGFLLANSRTGEYVVTHNRPSPGKDMHIPAPCWNVFLGHRRLAILDLSAKAAQPMGDPEGRFWITFNGEIYNFNEIRQELGKGGVVFRTDHSDTEVLLQAYMQWGEGCLGLLRGMFAFGIFDLKENRVFLARDRFGKKPLYYRLAPEGLQFASELKAIIADQGVPREIDPVALAQYMLYGYIPAPRTIYKGIAKLPAAHFAYFSLHWPTDIKIKRYWEFPQNVPGPKCNPKDWLEEFVAELNEAVRIRMISDVPLGAFASGGLDSTLVVRQMHQLSPEPTKTFSIGFEEEDFNELPWARQVAQHYRTEHYEEITQPDAISLLPRLVGLFDEPFGDPSAIPTLMVSELARRHVTVALSGDGGDELFAGYNRYHVADRLNRFVTPIPLLLRRTLFQNLGTLWPISWKGKGFITRLGADPQNLYRSTVARDTNFALLNGDLRNSINKVEVHDFFDGPWHRGPEDYVSRLQFLDIHTYLPEDILVKVDRTSMSVALEVRCPLLDHRLAELAVNLPRYFKYHNGDKKMIIKQVLLPEFGSSFIYRQKSGFGVPLKHWFSDNSRSFVQERLLNNSSNLSSLCDLKAVRKLFHDNLRGQRDLSTDLWRLLVLGEWCNQIHQGS